MFENDPSSLRPDSKQPAPQPSGPVIQDIFAQTDVSSNASSSTPFASTPAIDADIHQSASSSSPVFGSNPSFTSSIVAPSRFGFLSSPRFRILAAMLGVVVVCIVVLVAWTLLTDSDQDQQTANQNLNTINSTRPIQNSSLPSTHIGNQPSTVDTDGDGLTDADEINLKTDVRVIDTDQDGLTDREEVRVYTTNPLDSDTDNDSYLDGEEVKKLYNPKGSGKLLNINEEIRKIETNTNS